MGGLSRASAGNGAKKGSKTEMRKYKWCFHSSSDSERDRENTKTEKVNDRVVAVLVGHFC